MHRTSSPKPGSETPESQKVPFLLVKRIREAILDEVFQPGDRLIDCFCTNLFPGVRIAEKNTGRSTALGDKEFVGACFVFLDTQIRIVQPCAVAIMGLEPIGAILHRWLPQV